MRALGKQPVPSLTGHDPVPSLTGHDPLWHGRLTASCCPTCAEDLLSEAVHSAYMQRLVQPNDYVVSGQALRELPLACTRQPESVFTAACIGGGA